MIKIFNEIFHGKNIKLLFILSVFLIATTTSMITVVNAVDMPKSSSKTIDKGSFKIKGEKVYYDTSISTNKKLLSIDFYSAKFNNKKPKNYFYNTYKISKNKKFIKSTREYSNGKSVLLKNFKTNKSVNSFYKSHYKKYIINKEKTRLKKFLK